MSLDTPVISTAPKAPAKRRMGLKFLQIIAISAALGIALFIIFLITEERSARRQEALRSITQGWGEAQTVAGPILALPYLVETTVWDDKNKPKRQLIQHTLFMSPDRLSVQADLPAAKRYRGIYETLVYTANIQVDGQFSLPDFDALNTNAQDILWNEARLYLYVTDTIGLLEAPMLTLNKDTAKPMDPGLGGVGGYRTKGVQALVPQSALSKSLAFHITMKLRGSEQFQVLPLGPLTDVTLTSPSSSLSSAARFLPVSIENGEKKGKAVWSVPAVAHGNSSWHIDTKPFDQLTSCCDVQTVGAKLWLGLDSYDGVFRATKYGVLFVGLTLLALFLFEVVSRLRLHWTQYTLVGLAICLFYLILLSLAEHIAFDLAYLAGASAITITVTLYAISVLGQRRRALILLALLASLYTLFYVILSQEDYAMLMGSSMLFAALATTMYLTRRIDWFDDGVK